MAVKIQYLTIQALRNIKFRLKKILIKYAYSGVIVLRLKMELRVALWFSRMSRLKRS